MLYNITTFCRGIEFNFSSLLCPHVHPQLCRKQGKNQQELLVSPLHPAFRLFCSFFCITFLYPSLFFKSILRTETFYQDSKIKSFTKLSRNQVWKTRSFYLHNPFQLACFLSLAQPGQLHKATARNSDIYSPCCLPHPSAIVQSSVPTQAVTWLAETTSD